MAYFSKTSVDTKGNRLLLLFALLWVSATIPSSAQQWNQSSFVPLNPYREHAAYAGFDQSIAIHLHLRNQWVNLPGSPRFFYAGMHLPIYWGWVLTSKLLQTGCFNTAASGPPVPGFSGQQEAVFRWGQDWDFCKWASTAMSSERQVVIMKTALLTTMTPF